MRGRGQSRKPALDQDGSLHAMPIDADMTESTAEKPKGRSVTPWAAPRTKGMTDRRGGRVHDGTLPIKGGRLVTKWRCTAER